MGDGWVVFGYIVTYGAVVAYAVRLVLRMGAAIRNLPPSE